MHFLDAPAVLDEVAGQPVEQFGMRGALAHLAEIVGRADDAFAEMMLPDAIDHHARGQRIRSALAIQRASASRRPSASLGHRHAPAARYTLRTPGVTFSPGVFRLPPGRMKVSGDAAFASATANASGS